MIELLVALIPLFSEVIREIISNRDATIEERKQLNDEILEAVRGGDAGSVNRLVVRLRLKRTIRSAQAHRRKRDREDGGGPESYA